MYSLFVECPAAEAELLSAELWEEGATGIQEDSLPGARIQLRAWFEDPAGLTKRFKEFRPRIQAEPDVDWEMAARQAWQPFTVGRRLYLAPEWDENSTPRGRTRLTIHPGEALGTGAHPSTQLCLEALESLLRPDDRVLDLGAGSGILTAAAWLLGAQNVIGCDMDQHSIAICRRNLLSDGMTPHVFAGSTRSVRTQAIDVVVANINAVTHETLAGEYARITRRSVVVSGFPQRHAGTVAAALSRHGFTAANTLTREEWVCFTLCRDAAS